MKKSLNKFFVFFKILAAALLTLYCLIETSAVQDAVYDSLMRCLNIVIPSLYGMMIMSVFLSKCGFFGMFSGIIPIFIVSQFAGYPVGAKLLCSEYEKGRLSRRQAEIYSGVCFGAGPAFIFGCISSQLYGNNSAGLTILISVVLSNLILFIISSFFSVRENVEQSKNKIEISLEMITDSILSGGRAMADICFMISAFAIISSSIKHIGAVNRIASWISEFSDISSQRICGIFDAFLDVTNISGVEHGDYLILPVISGLVSFGGICVLMQINAVTKGSIRIFPLLFFRSIAAALSTIICSLIMPFMLDTETVSAGNFAIHKADSPVPSIMLIFMTLFLFSGFNDESKKREN